MITTDTHIFFYTDTIYSNWHRTRHQFKDPLNGDLSFDSSEQAFFWWKAVFHQDHRIATLLEREIIPGQCKALGRRIEGYNDKAWECVRLGFMQYVLLLKFSQNPEWAAELKATGNRILVEASPTDCIWGIGRDVDEAAAGASWRGRNLLGVALMTVRGLLEKDSS